VKDYNFKEFNAFYQKSGADIYQMWDPQKQKEISLHCAAWIREILIILNIYFKIILT